MENFEKSQDTKNNKPIEKAIRYNKGKNMLSLIPVELIEQVGLVMTAGAEKYSKHNWKGFTEEQQEEIMDSLLRHIMAHLKGETFDKETGLPHLAHAGANIGFALWFMRQKGIIK